MTYLDLNKVHNGDLYLPWNGREWRVEEPAATESQRLRPLVWSDAYTGDVELLEIEKLLGDTWRDLIAAGITWPKLLHFGRTAMIWATSTPEAAEAFWKMHEFAQLVVDLKAAEEGADA